MNPIAVNTVAIREDPSQYLIRYGIEKDRFAQVLSSGVSSDFRALPAKQQF